MQARLRAQLGDRSKYSGERRRRSVVVASIVLTITDPLRGSYPFWYYLQAALIRSCGASFACMELTIISRFQRLQASTNRHFYSFSVLSPKACFQCNDKLQFVSKHAKGESTEKVQFFKDQNEKCLRFITFLSTNRLNKAMIGRKRRVKRLFLRY